jgi:hypothetical protein
MQLISEQPTAQALPAAAARPTKSNRQGLHFMLGAQGIIFEETVFAVGVTLERILTEIHLFGEFAAKLASAHSVQDWNAMGRECSQHQLEFVRRDCDRLLRHSERLIDAASNFLSNRQ